MVLYLDDLHISQFGKQLQNKYDMTNLGLVSKF